MGLGRAQGYKQAAPPGAGASRTLQPGVEKSFTAGRTRRKSGLDAAIGHINGNEPFGYHAKTG